MPAKFNFLAPRTERLRTEAALHKRFPNRSAIWIAHSAERLTPQEDITMELRAPDPSAYRSLTK